MNPRLPTPNYVLEPEFWWPWAKFCLPPNALHTSLHERFNTRSTVIQEPYAFQRDVIECANNSSSLNEFYDELTKRKAERLDEMNAAWTEIIHLLGGRPAAFCCSRCNGHLRSDSNSEASIWGSFVRLCRNMSSDCLVLYFDEYARDERRRQQKKWDEAQKELDALFPHRNNNTSKGQFLPSVSQPASGTVTNATELRPAPLESSTKLHRPNESDRVLPSSAPSSSSPSRTRKRGSSAPLPGTSTPQLMASVCQSKPISQKQDGTYTRKQVGDDIGGAGEIVPEHNLDFCFPTSPNSSCDEAVVTGNAGDQPRAVPGPSTLVLKQEALLRASHRRNSTGQDTACLSPSAPKSRPAKRKSLEDGEWGTGVQAPLYMSKIRRLSPSCGGVEKFKQPEG